MATCYVTGKMRSIKSFNFPLFNQVSSLLRHAGWSVISPAEMDREAEEPWTNPADPDFADETWKVSQQDCRRLIRRDVDAILTLRPQHGDVVVLLPGWDDESTGAFGEAGVARWAMIPLMEFQFDHVPAHRVKKIGAAPQLRFSLHTLPDDAWGAKANMIPGEKI